jgi:hypothetical protein
MGRDGIWNVSQRLTLDQAAELAGGFVVAGGAAGFAVHEAIFADADIELRLAQDAELVALALIFHHFALAATKFGVTRSHGHESNVALGRGVGNVPLVTSIVDC